MNNGPFTEDELDQLKRLWEQGMLTREIAKALGRSKNSVVGKAHRLGLKARPSPIRGKRVGPPKPRVEKPARVVVRSFFRPRPPKPPTKPVPQPYDGPLVAGVGGRRDVCQWIPGDPMGADTLYCGQTTVRGCYCEYHHSLSVRIVKA